VNPSETRSDQSRRGSSATRARDDLAVIARTRTPARKQPARRPTGPALGLQARRSLAGSTPRAQSGRPAAADGPSSRREAAPSGVACASSRAAWIGPARAPATPLPRPSRHGRLEARQRLDARQSEPGPAPAQAAAGSTTAERRTRALPPRRRLKPSPSGEPPPCAKAAAPPPDPGPGTDPPGGRRRDRALRRRRRRAVPARR
jgi:hypothetical protein